MDVGRSIANCSSDGTTSGVGAGVGVGSLSGGATCGVGAGAGAGVGAGIGVGSYPVARLPASERIRASSRRGLLIFSDFGVAGGGVGLSTGLTSSCFCSICGAALLAGRGR